MVPKTESGDIDILGQSVCVCVKEKVFVLLRARELFARYDSDKIAQNLWMVAGSPGNKNETEAVMAETYPEFAVDAAGDPVMKVVITIFDEPAGFPYWNYDVVVKIVGSSGAGSAGAVAGSHGLTSYVSNSKTSTCLPGSANDEEDVPLVPSASNEDVVVVVSGNATDHHSHSHIPAVTAPPVDDSQLNLVER